MSEKIKTLADLLRNKIAEPSIGDEQKPPKIKKEPKTKINRNQEEEILKSIRAHEYNGKNMLHPRLDDKTVRMLSQFKIATGVDMNKVIAFSINYLFAQNPELKQIIKTSLENFDL